MCGLPANKNLPAHGFTRLLAIAILGSYHAILSRKRNFSPQIGSFKIIGCARPALWTKNIYPKAPPHMHYACMKKGSKYENKHVPNTNRIFG